MKILFEEYHYKSEQVKGILGHHFHNPVSKFVKEHLGAGKSFAPTKATRAKEFVMDEEGLLIGMVYGDGKTAEF